MNTFSKLAFAGTATLASLSACSGERAEFSPETAPTMIEQAQEGPVPSLEEETTPSTAPLLPAESAVGCQPYIPAAFEEIGVLYFTDPALETEDEYYSRLTRELPEGQNMTALGSCYGIEVEMLYDLINTDARPVNAVVNGEITNPDNSRTVITDVQCVVTGLAAELDLNGVVDAVDIEPTMDGDQIIVELTCNVEGITDIAPSV